MAPSSTSPTERRYGGKSADERRSERRERLLSAGSELFGSQGYAGTTIEALCRRAKLNPRYFYAEFGAREALLGAVFDRHMETVTSRVLTALEDSPPDPLARLEAGLGAFLEAIAADEHAARINYFEMVGVSPELARRRRDVLRFYADLIAGQIEEIAASKPLPIGDHHLAAVALVGVVDGLLLDALSGTGPIDRPRILATVLEITRAALASTGRRRD